LPEDIQALIDDLPKGYSKCLGCGEIWVVGQPECPKCGWVPINLLDEV